MLRDGKSNRRHVERESVKRAWKRKGHVDFSFSAASATKESEMDRVEACVCSI